MGFIYDLLLILGFVVVYIIIGVYTDAFVQGAYSVTGWFVLFWPFAWVWYLLRTIIRLIPKRIVKLLDHYFDPETIAAFGVSYRRWLNREEKS